MDSIKDLSEPYKTFLNVFSNLYEIAFPKIKIKVNSKTRLSPWITRGILKSSKRKQKLYQIFKNRTSLNEKNYKTFAHLFESIKQKSKKNCYYNLLITYENDMKRTCVTIKEIIGSKISSRTLFSKRLVVNDLEFFDKKTIVEKFSKFSCEVGATLASKIPHLLISFEHFLHGDYPSLEKKPIRDDELNEALPTLKTKKVLDMMRFLPMLSIISHHIFLSLQDRFSTCL